MFHRYTNIFSLLCIVIFGLTLVSCQTTPNPKPEPEPNPYLRYLLTYDPAILKKVTITHVDKRLYNGIMSSTVAIKNLKKNPITLRYKFSWFDERNTEVRPNDETWQQISLSAFETMSLPATAPNSAVTSFKFSLQETSQNNTQSRLNLRDILQVANSIVDSFLINTDIVEATTQRRPVMYVHDIKNLTEEHIPPGSIANSISQKMSNSGKFRFTDITVVEEALEQKDFQNIDFIVDPKTAARLAK